MKESETLINSTGQRIERSSPTPDYLKWKYAWDIFNNQVFDYKRDAELTHAWISENGYKVNDIVDLGCGAGRHLLHLREIGYSCTGLDKDIEILQYARVLSTKADINLISSDILQEPGEEFQNRFDLILAKHLSFSAEDTKRLLLNARKLLKTDSPKVIISDFLISNGENLERNIFSMDTHSEEDFQIARLNSMELVQDMNKYNWRELYLLIQKDGLLDIKVNSRNLWFHTTDELMEILDGVGILIQDSSSEATGIPGLIGTVIYGKFRN